MKIRPLHDRIIVRRKEEIIGNWLEGKKREDFIISTKIAGPRRSIDWIREGLNHLIEKILMRLLIIL